MHPPFIFKWSKPGLCPSKVDSLSLRIQVDTCRRACLCDLPLATSQWQHLAERSKKFKLRRTQNGDRSFMNYIYMYTSLNVVATTAHPCLIDEFPKLGYPGQRAEKNGAMELTGGWPLRHSSMFFMIGGDQACKNRLFAWISRGLNVYGHVPEKVTTHFLIDISLAKNSPSHLQMLSTQKCSEPRQSDFGQRIRLRMKRHTERSLFYYAAILTFSKPTNFCLHQKSRHTHAAKAVKIKNRQFHILTTMAWPWV